MERAWWSEVGGMSPLLRFAQQQPASPLQQQQGGHIHLLSTQRMSVSNQAKWADLHADSQQLLLHVEERVREYREESRRLEQRERGSDSVALDKGFELDAARISQQELAGVAGAVEREAGAVREGQAEASLQMLRHAEVAVRSFLLMRPRGTMAQGLLLDFYSGPPAKPSQFLQQTVTRFERQLSDYRQRIEELERLLLARTEKGTGFGSQLSLLQSLPTVMTNVHDFFIHVAAEVESLHQHTGAMRSAFLGGRRRCGDDSNPFVEAERRAVAQRDAAAKRVLHPTLHLPPPAPISSSTRATQGQPTSNMGSQSLFGTPATTALSLFGSGAANTTATAAASSPSLFGSSFSVPALPPAGSTPVQSGGLLGAATASATSLFGASSSGSGLTGGAPSSSPLFSTPAPPTFGATNMGAPLFGIGSTTGTTAAVKPKPRGTRRK